MNNNIEVIDGVTGEWRPINREEGLSVGQMVRYCNSGTIECSFGYEDDRRFYQSKNGIDTFVDKDGFSCSQHNFGYWNIIEAFFPNKVAKVVISSDHVLYWFTMTIGRMSPIKSVQFSSRKSTIRSAQRLCELIGYECEIVK